MNAATGTHTEGDNITLLRDIKLPKLTTVDNDYLESDITIDEIAQAIRALHSGKASGPNGLPIELFKITPEAVALHLLAMFNTSKELGELPIDQRIANIMVIPKPNKPLAQCSSYRPISLLNVEPKILAKIIATRLIKIISTLVQPDQSGFMPHRNTALNLRRLHGVLAGANKIHEPAVLVLLDAAMAFDMVEWPYLFAVLEKFGFGPNFVSWIRLLYIKPMAQVVVNNRKSQLFLLSRGTRQGCPLSPLLFALALEPLAAWIRMDPRTSLDPRVGGQDLPICR